MNKKHIKILNNSKPLVVVILGTTASGKTGLGIALADKFNGEIISADSRQVYKGMDIGSGKDLKDYTIKKSDGKKKKIKYHLIDVVSPKTEFNLRKYQRLTSKAIDDILQRKKLPIIVGGTGLYLQAIVDNYQLSDIKADKIWRNEIERLTIDQLYKRIYKKNKAFAEKLNNSDKNNQRRLIRYLEILEKDLNYSASRKDSPYDFLILGLDWSKEILEKRIYQRLIDRLEKEDMVGEIRRLHRQGVSWKRLESFGLEYRYVSFYLQGKMNYEEMVEKLFIAIRQFAKRQKTWYRRWERQGKKIYWVKDKKESLKLISKNKKNL